MKPEREQSARADLAWAAAAGGAIWLPLLLRWQQTWRSDEAYYYGWAVPPLAAYLAWLRREDAFTGPTPSGWGRHRALLAVALGCLMAALSLPLLEASPIWPAAGWFGGVGAVACCLGLLALAGGWPAAVHFVFPLGFLLTALRLPSVVEQPLMTGLMETNAVMAAEVVSLLGHPALVHGRVIEVAQGYVGIEEACSGMRSLFTVVMVALFFGELGRWSWRRRLGLLAGAVMAALLGNAARTTFLAWRVASSGTGAAEALHDLTGNIALGLTLGAVAALAYAMSRPPSVQGAALRQADRRWARPTFALAAVVVAGLGSELATRVWFESHESAPRIPVAGWTLEPREGEWAEMPIAKGIAEGLGYVRARQLRWQNPREGTNGVAFWAQWDGDPANAGLALFHDPTLCLPGTGLRLEAELAPRTIEREGRKVAFQVWRFRHQGGPVWVWFCVWHGQRATSLAGGNEAWKDLTRDRWHRVQSGRRRLDLTQLTFTVQGAKDEAAASSALRTVINSALQAAP